LCHSWHSWKDRKNHFLELSHTPCWSGVALGTYLLYEFCLMTHCLRSRKFSNIMHQWLQK
jgi:hypothetical protein